MIRIQIVKHAPPKSAAAPVDTRTPSGKSLPW